MPQITIAYGRDAADMATRLLHSAGVAGMIPQGASIALKPNLVTASPAQHGATTHPEILEAILSYLFEHGHKDVCILEGAWVGCRTEEAFRRCGYTALAKRFSIGLYDLKKDSARAVDSPIGPLQVCERALRADFLINLPVLKGHCQTTMTCALKNLKGCIPDSEKRRFHTMGLHQPIAALATVLRPQLNIVDSICGDLNFEEGGTPVQTNRLYMGTDPVQLDAYGCGLMGISQNQVRYIALAEQYGAGSSAYTQADLHTLGDPALCGAYPQQSGEVSRLVRGVRQQDACSACFGNLVHALYRLGRPAPEGVFIGQGYKGQPLEGLGIGECCKGATRCVHGCPPSADAIRHALEQQPV